MFSVSKAVCTQQSHMQDGSTEAHRIWQQFTVLFSPRSLPQLFSVRFMTNLTGKISVCLRIKLETDGVTVGTHKILLLSLYSSV